MHERSQTRRLLASLTCLSVSFLLGCGQSAVVEVEKAPRPVSVITLKTSAPTTNRRVSATVSSWKTEEIGFEVSGRVRWVLEPGEDIEGRVFDPQGAIITQGTVLAQVDAEQYELAVEAAKARVSVAELEKASVEVDLKQGIPADVEAAKADLELARIEFARTKRVVDRQAAPEADLDQARATLRTAQAQIATLNAREKRTEAQLASSNASINQAQQDLKDAERNLANTTLYSSFRGQVADVHVVPGSVVSVGSPVLTVQMMNPIKVEVELSADLSRTIRQQHQLPVFVTMPDGSVEQQAGYVYAVSPTADTSTRTFTLTLLVLNKKLKEPLPDGFQSGGVARTPDIWRLDLDFLPNGVDGYYYIDQQAIHQDAEGAYVWKCLNAKVGRPLPSTVLRVAKMRVTLGDRSIPFLGNWVFRAVTVNDGEEFDPQADLFAGELQVDQGTPDAWDGEQIFLDDGEQWMLRPGDLAGVDLGGAPVAAGFYVPLEAVYEESGETYVFVVDESEAGVVATRVAVRVAQENEVGSGTTCRITPQSPDGLTDGMRVVVGGVHFLNDGEKIRVARQD